MSLLSTEAVQQWALDEGLPVHRVFAVSCVPISVSTHRLTEALKAHETLQHASPVDKREDDDDSYGLFTHYLCCSEVDLNPVKGPFCIYPKGAEESGCAVVFPVLSSSVRRKLPALPVKCETASVPHRETATTPAMSVQQETNIEQLLLKVTEVISQNLHADAHRKLKSFSGIMPVPAGEENFEAWKDYALQVMEEWTCSEERRKQRIMESLRSPASLIVKAYKDTHVSTTAQDYIDVLTSAYGQHCDPDQMLADFKQTKHKEGEDVSVFVRRLEVLLARLLTERVISPAEVDKLRTVQIIKGLLPHHPISPVLRVILREKNFTFIEIMTEIKKQESDMCFCTPIKSKTKTSSSDGGDNEAVDKLKMHNQRSVPEAPSTVTKIRHFKSPSMMKCFRCGQIGHGVSQCPLHTDTLEVHSKMGQSYKRKPRKVKTRYGTALPGIGRRCTFSLLVNGVPTTALFDTGSQLTIIHRPFYQQHLSHMPLQTLDTMPVYGVGENPVYMDGCLEVELRIPGVVADEDPPLKVVAYVSPSPGGKESAPMIVGSNVEAVEAAFLRFLQPQQGTPLTALPVAPELQNICHTFAPQLPGGCVGNPWRPVELQPGEVRTLRVYVEIMPGANNGFFLFETDPTEAIKNGWEIIPERKDYRIKCPRTDDVTVRNIAAHPIVIPAWQEVAYCYSVENLESYPVEVNKQEVPLDFHLEDADSPPEHKEAICEQLKGYSDVFSTGDMDVGCAKSIQHKIRLKDTTPFRERSRRIPLKDLDDVRECLQKMKDQNIIVESRSPYASPIVVVRKKSGEVRICVDYRTLNRRTIPDQYTLPRIEEALDALQGSKWFSVMDLRSGYYQIPMSEEDQEKTAFICPVGFFQSVRMPQGLAGAPATFQRLMDRTLGDLCPKECIVYLDDIIVFGSTLEEHDDRLYKVLDRLRKEGLKLSLDKCKFVRSSVNFVGHIVSGEGVATDPAKIEAVVNWPRPSNLTELRSFLGFCGYYRRFIEGYSKIARPLNDLLKETPASDKGNSTAIRAPFSEKWTPLCEEAFSHLKKRLTEAPVLAYADSTRPYILHVDASYDGLGGVLHQQYPGGLRPVAYVSRSLSPSEKNYSVHKLEFLALKWAVVEKLHEYLYGAQFEVRTDNNPLTYVLTTAKLDATGHRWLAALSNYQFTLKYKPGPKNIGADALSRRPGLPPSTDEEEWEEIPGPAVGAYCAMATIQEDKITFSDMRVVDSLGANEECIPEMYCCPSALGVPWNIQLKSKDMINLQKRDSVIKHVREAVRCKDPTYMKKVLPEGSTYYLREWDKLQIINGLLYRVHLFHDHPGRRQLVLPQIYRQTVLRSLHDHHGHLGVEKTYGLIQDRFFWPKMREAVTDHCRRCVRCLQRKTLPTRAAHMEHLKSSGPMDLVCMDFLCIDSDTSGVGNVLIVTDHYTRYAQAFPTKDQKAVTVAKVLWEKFFVHYGLPNRLHSDQGRDFESRLVKELLQLLNIDKSRTTPYHPEGDALPERFNRTLLNMLGTLPESAKQTWSRHVGAMVHAYNCTRHESTGFSPYFLMFGREARLPIDIQLGVSTDGVGHQSHYQYVSRLKNSLREAYQMAEENASKINAANKRRFDAKVRFRDLKAGDKVFLRNLGPSAKHKLADRWRKDLFEVVAQLPGIPVYKIKGPDGSVKAWHRNHLLPVPEVSIPDEVLPSNSCPDSTDVPSNEEEIQNDESDWFTAPPESPARPSMSGGGLPQRGGLNPNSPAFEPIQQDFVPTVPAMSGAPTIPNDSTSGLSGSIPDGVRRGNRVRRPPPVFTYDSLGRPCYAVQSYLVQPYALMDMIAAHARLVSLIPSCY